MSDIPTAIEVAGVPEVPNKRPALFAAAKYLGYIPGWNLYRVRDDHKPETGETLFRIPAEGDAVAAPAGWIPVGQRMPEDSEAWVLVYADGAMGCMGFRHGKFVDFVSIRASNIAISQITHWMPLPEPPK